MIVYLAGPYRARAQLQRCAADLERIGFTVRARWLDGEHEGAPDAANDAAPADRERWAREDLADVAQCNVLVAFTARAAWDLALTTTSRPPAEFGASGGRHIETGYALARLKTVVLVGHPENVFHWLPQVNRVTDWHEALVLLASVLVHQERDRATAAS